MAELIYNINNIFSNSNSADCLVEYDVDKYHIAAYQRGYKWASDEYGAVTILLNDLWDAFQAYQKKERKEYYLQYITLKRDNDKRFLEVIDGQQRLTTLSILLSVFSLKMDITNIAEKKLEYAIRSNFLNDHIYNLANLLILIDKEWEADKGLVFSDGTFLNNQDVYYLFSAVKKISSFLDGDEVNKRINEFYQFILEHVKIIVNAVDYISSEKVFSNLNSNKVPLTESELIKGLLLTKFSRLENKNEEQKQFREILELRMSLGRHWDEMTRWSNQPEIKSFYFKETEGMEGLLQLVAISLGYTININANPKDYPLFNFFHRFGKIEAVYQTLNDFQALLKDWYFDDKTYNLLGFVFFAKGSSIKLVNLITHFKATKSDFKKFLNEEVIKLIPSNGSDLYYGNNQDSEIHRVLLALSVFSHGDLIRFNYHRFITENWTLEHIFPQTPEGKGQKLTAQDKELILEMLGKNVTPEIEDILKKDAREPAEREIYQIALKGTGSLNSIGNMCLLTAQDNISNGCGFFDEKRTNILHRIRKGSFVPKHTFDVFSKMTFENDPGNLERWTKGNIDQHILIIKKKIEDLNIDNL